MSKNKSKPIFVSHAATDKAIADKVVDLLNTAMAIDVQRSVFCTSLEGLKIPAGMDFKQFIKDQIQEPQIVLLLISQNYLASQFCLAEVGASWAMSHRIIPLLITPAKYDDMKAVLTGIHALKIEDPGDWNEALAVFKEVQGIDPNPNRWERKRDEKIAEIVALIPNQPPPPIVPLHKFQEVQAKLNGANAEISELEKANRQLEKLLKEVKKLKDAKTVARVELENLPVAEAFDKLIGKAKAALSPFNGEMWEAFYYYFRHEPMPEPRFGNSDTEDRYDERRRALEDGYLRETSMGDIQLNEGDPSVKKALTALEELRSFIESNSEISSPYEEEEGHQLDFNSRRFWEAKL